MTSNEIKTIELIVNSEQARKRLDELKTKLEQLKTKREEALERGDSRAFSLYSKEIKKVETIEVKQNPKTRKLFFVYGVETGAVSSRYKQGIPNNDVISLVETDKGDSFFLLHNLNEGPTVSKR